MIEERIMIVNKLGLHARAAAKFVGCASRYRSDVRLVRGSRKVNGKSIMGVMMLAASQGTQLIVEVDGEDEAEAVTAIKDLIADRFGESE